MLWSLVAVFVVFFLKICISDVIVFVRKVKGNVAMNRRIV